MVPEVGETVGPEVEWDSEMAFTGVRKANGAPREHLRGTCPHTCRCACQTTLVGTKEGLCVTTHLVPQIYGLYSYGRYSYGLGRHISYRRSMEASFTHACLPQIVNVPLDLGTTDNLGHDYMGHNYIGPP